MPGIRFGGTLFVLLVSSADSYLMKPSTKALDPRGHVQRSVQMGMMVVYEQEGEMIVESTHAKVSIFIRRNIIDLKR